MWETDEELAMDDPDEIVIPDLSSQLPYRHPLNGMLQSRFSVPRDPPRREYSKLRTERIFAPKYSNKGSRFKRTMIATSSRLNLAKVKGLAEVEPESDEKNEAKSESLKTRSLCLLLIIATLLYAIYRFPDIGTLAIDRRVIREPTYDDYKDSPIEVPIQDVYPSEKLVLITLVEEYFFMYENQQQNE